MLYKTPLTMYYYACMFNIQYSHKAVNCKRSTMDDILQENGSFTTDKDINGPLVATIVSLEVLAALVTNLFVLIFTLCHPKILKQSSILFLTNFVLANLLMAIVYMPTIIVTAAAGEWVFGRNINEKVASCGFIGFIFNHDLFVATLTLTAISVDRFLFIVKPFIHKQYMKTWVVVVINVLTWILPCFLTIPPFFGFGRYNFSTYIASCIPVWDSDKIYTALNLLVVIVCMMVIIVTSIWTFCFTQNFIKRTESFSSSNEENKHVYNRRVVKIMGIFGTMLLVTAVTYAPGAIACLIGFIISFENLPSKLFPAIMLLFFTLTVSNPIIQSYFRRELKDFIVTYTKRFFSCHQTHPSSIQPMVSKTSSEVTGPV